MQSQKTVPSPDRKSTNVRSTIAADLLRSVVRFGGSVAPHATSGMLLDAFSKTHRERQRSRDLADRFLFAERWAIDHRGRALRGITVRPEGDHPAYDGDGPAVLLVHGWDGGSHQLEAFMRRLVETGHVVTAFDQPGHGASDGERTNLRDMADAVTAVARARGPFAGVVAHSVGAGAVTLAMLEGLEIDGAVFVAPPTSLEAALRAFAGSVGAADETVATMLATLRGIVGRPVDTASWQASVRGLRARLLVVHDREDKVTSFEGSEQLVREWPGAELVATRGLGHARILRDERVVGRAVEFLRGAADQARSPATSSSSVCQSGNDQRPKIVAPDS